MTTPDFDAGFAAGWAARELALVQQAEIERKLLDVALQPQITERVECQPDTDAGGQS